MPRKKNQTVTPVEQAVNQPVQKQSPFPYEPKSLASADRESLGYYGGGFDDCILPERDDASLHTGMGRDFLRFNNLINFRMPYMEWGRFIYMREPIRLCQTAWREVPVIYQTIETMTELANSGIKLSRGSDRCRKFFTSWFSTFNLLNLMEQFFREMFRSGNIFVYRYDGSIKSNKLNKFIFSNKTEKGNKESRGARSIPIPVRYVILNPAFVALYNGLDLNEVPVYYWLVDTASRNQLRKLQDKGSDIQFSKETQNILDNNISETKLDSDKMYPLFYRKQDYEPFALPMCYPVLDQVNLKLEFQKCDQVVAKTVESIVTLVKHGTQDKDGQMIVNPLVAQALEKMFVTKQTGRTIVTTSDTSIEFVIPDLQKVVGPEKYQKLDQDINDGLMNIFFGDQKFANIMVKLRVFVERIEYAQSIFLNQFLIPEMKRVGKIAGYKPEDIPTPRFGPVKVDDPTNFQRVVAQLLQLGLLTPQDMKDAMEAGVLPDYEDLLENQKEYKAARKQQLFYPLIGGSDPDGQSASPTGAGGRPTGSKGPKTKNSPGFKGKSKASEFQYDVVKFREYTVLASRVADQLEQEYKKKRNRTSLTKKDRQYLKTVADHLIANENPDHWSENIPTYLGEIPQPNFENIGRITEIKEYQNIEDDLSAALLMWSQRSDIQTESE